jgi:hypothetical protein
MLFVGLVQVSPYSSSSYCSIFRVVLVATITRLFRVVIQEALLPGTQKLSPMLHPADVTPTGLSQTSASHRSTSTYGQVGSCLGQACTQSQAACQHTRNVVHDWPFTCQ